MAKDAVDLSGCELKRYNRQMMLPGWGEDGQIRVKRAKVLVAGAGGLGCPAALYLAAAGVGELLVVDNEEFELSNLNRQVLGWLKDVGRPKAEAVAEKLRALNPGVHVKPLILEISEDNIGELIQGVDVVVDALDNWKTRFTINRGCVEEETPLVHAGVYGLYGQVMTIIPGKGPCLRCLLPQKPREMEEFPVPGATPALFASLQVMETLKLIVGIGETLTGRMLFFDGESMNPTVIEVEKRVDCPICGGI